MLRLKRKNFAFGLGSLMNGFKGMATSAAQTQRLQNIVNAGKGGMKLSGGTTASQALSNAQNVKSNLTKGVLGVGTTAAVGAGAVGTWNAFTGNSGNND